MSRTNGRFEAKTGFPDGLYFLGAADIINPGGNGVVTKNASGDVSWNVAASLSAVFILGLTGIVQRIGAAPFLQEQFGTAAGVAGPTSVANTSDPDAEPAPYYPPFPKASLPMIAGPQAGYVPKGIQINDVTLHYFISGAALTTHTVGVTKTVFPVSGTPAAVVVTNIIANAANGLATATNANPQSTKVAVATPAYTVNDLAELQVEVDVTTQAAGAYRLYGASIHVTYNFN